MFLKEKNTDHLVEVLDMATLIDPAETHFQGRYNWGQDLPDPEPFAKAALVFPSGEDLPRCWTDSHYRDEEIPH